VRLSDCRGLLAKRITTAPVPSPEKHDAYPPLAEMDLARWMRIQAPISRRRER